MKLGVIGMGSIGKRHTANLLEMGHQVIGLDAQPDKSLELCPIVSDPADFWQEKLDAVLICTPPNSHCVLASRALQRGHHVFIEKPISERHGGATWLEAIARRMNTVLAIGFQLRWSLVHKFQRWTPGRDLDIVLRCDMATWPSQYQKDALLECSHEIDAAVFLNGPVKEVTGYHLSPYRWRLYLKHLAALSVITIETDHERYTRTIIGIEYTGTEEWTFSQSENDAAYKSELRAFIGAIEGRPMDKCLCTVSEAAHVMQIIDACRESASQCKVVSIA